MKKILNKTIGIIMAVCMVVSTFDLTVFAAKPKTFLDSAGRLQMWAKSKAFDLPAQAKKKTYDTMQGGCTDGKYVYYVLYDRNKEKCKISKVRRYDWKVVKTSGVLSIDHGNDLTYNSRTKQLVAVHSTIHHLRVSVIDPSTLRRLYYKDIVIPQKVDGLRKSLRKKVKGIYGIAYNSSKKKYVVGVSSLGDFMILNQDFEVVKYCETKVNLSYTRQGLDSEGRYIYLAQSAGKYPGNIIAVYRWDGSYVTAIWIQQSFEIENMFHYKGKYYVGFYSSFYKKVKNNYELKRIGYVYRIEFNRAAAIQYRSNGGEGSMSNSILYYGIPKILNGNEFKKKGYKFKGWKVYRSIDDRYYGYNKNGKLGWYKKRNIKKYKYLSNRATISKTASSGWIILTAKWKKKK